MVAMGTKSYFYREKELGDGQGIFVNDSFKAEVNGEDEAYDAIEKELNVKPLKLGYIPPDMDFLGLYIEDGIAYMKFSYMQGNVFLIQAKYNKKVSYNYKDDSKYKLNIYNKWIGEYLDIHRETLSDEKMRYDTSVILDGSYYSISGVMDESEFQQIVERLTF